MINTSSGASERTRTIDDSCPSVTFHCDATAIVSNMELMEVPLDSLGGVIQPSSKGSLSSLKKILTYLE